MATDDSLPFGSEDEVRTRLEQWPGLGSRISTIVAARRGTRTARRSPKNLGLLVGAAIAVAMAVTVAIMVITRPDESPKAEPVQAHIMDAYIGSLGEIGTDDALRTAIQRRGPVDQGLTRDPTATSLLNGSGLSIAAERCVRVNIPGKSVGLLATGTWKAQPVVVYVAEVTGADVAFVSDLSSCAIVYSLRV